MKRLMSILLGFSLGAGVAGSLVTGASAVSAAALPLSISSTLGCVETVIAKVQPSSDASGAGSGFIAFRDDIAPGRGARNQKIMSVTLAYTTDVPEMHVGDRARVCLAFMPQADTSVPHGCDPEQDPRGRRFVILDRATGTVAQYYDGIHLCGGA